jgi:hypothetical protein
VDVQAKAQSRQFDARLAEESQEKHDHAGVTIDEPHALAAPVRLALGTFAPVGDGARNDDLAGGQRADLGSRLVADRLPPGFPGRSLGLPVQP